MAKRKSRKVGRANKDQPEGTRPQKQCYTMERTQAEPSKLTREVKEGGSGEGKIARRREPFARRVKSQIHLSIDLKFRGEGEATSRAQQVPNKCE